MPSPAIRKLLESVRSKRARVVIDHIMKHGQITTEDLEKRYGYKHPPRAIRDVREAGIPLVSSRVKSSDGRSIAAYKFGNLAAVTHGRLAGRTPLPRTLRAELYKRGRGKCYVCSGRFEERYLQIDHRVPYEIAGERRDPAKPERSFMLLCGSCNRAKSWSCEHCGNWGSKGRAGICARCYWSNPLSYSHIALRPVRRADIQWEADEVAEYERLRKRSRASSETVPEYVKRVLRQALADKR